MPYAQGYFDAVYHRPHDDGYAFSDQEKHDYHRGYLDGLAEQEQTLSPE